DDDPVLFFEHKGLYGRKGQVMLGDDAIARIGEAAVLREGTDVTDVSTLLIVEEQVHAGGWGATVISELVQRGVPMGRPATLSLPDDILIAYAPELEDAIIPSVEAIAGQIRSVVEG